MVNKIPEGYSTLTGLLNIKGADKAIELYKKALGAKLDSQLLCPETGKVMHAELTIGDTKLMLGEAMGEWEPSKSSFCCYVEDTDAGFKKSVAAGMKSEMEPEDMFWGDRMGSVVDPFGNHWSIATHIRDMSQDEIQQAGKEWMAKQKQKKAA